MVAVRRLPLPRQASPSAVYTELCSFGDIKGRLGYADGPALWFVSGGAAVGDILHHYNAGLIPPSVSASDTRWGRIAGAPAPNTCSRRTGRPRSNTTTSISYIDLGKGSLQYDPLVAINRSEWSDTFQTVKAGLNYH